MALFNCSECGKEYSDKAPACPNCGCPTSPGGMTPISPPAESELSPAEIANRQRQKVLSGGRKAPEATEGGQSVNVTVNNNGCAGCLLVVLAFGLLAMFLGPLMQPTNTPSGQTEQVR